MIRISSLAQPSSIRRVVAILGLVGMGMAQAAAPDDAPPASAKQTATSTETPAPRSKAKIADTVTRGKAKTTLRDTKDTGDPLTADVLADVLGDAELANQRGGAETHLNQNNATGTVAGNVASQLNTGSNTISESAFSNTAGIPIVIQNSGNNVLIQNSTILNLSLTNPK